jgi:16S rRNA processing protein RimM
MARKPVSGQSAQTQLRVGRLTKAHGLKGGLKLELFTDDPERRFQPGAEFSLQVPTSSPWHGKKLALGELRWYNGQPVGFFEGVTDREGAESLVKAILWVDSSPDEPPEEDAWYDHQLVGLAVVRDGAPIGTIARVEHFPAQDLLVVSVGNREVLVPFVKAIVPSVDIERRIVIVTPPAGLFEDLPDEDDGEPQAAGAGASTGKSSTGKSSTGKSSTGKSGRAVDAEAIADTAEGGHAGPTVGSGQASAAESTPETGSTEDAETATESVGTAASASAESGGSAGPASTEAADPAIGSAAETEGQAQRATAAVDSDA